MNLAEENERKYLVPPTIEQINSFIAEVGVSTARFERFFAIPYNCITNVRSGHRELPRAYWHIFYERVIPEVGVGYRKASKPMKKSKKPLPKPLPRPVQAETSKPILSQTAAGQETPVSHPALSKLRFSKP